MQSFEVVVIGGGPGGYIAAIQAAGRGASVALIESGALGGTCLNRGCIPTKTLLANADLWEMIKRSSDFGISVENCSFDFAAMVHKKEEIVSTLRDHLNQLIPKRGIQLFSGRGVLRDAHCVKILGEKNDQIRAEKIILATGSYPKQVPAFPFDGKRIHSSDTLLSLKELPRRIAIIGGGVIGCEFASLYCRLGVEVTLIEALDHILPLEAEEVSDFFTQSLPQKGVRLILGQSVCKMCSEREQLLLELSNREAISTECALVAIGRSFHTEGLGLERVGVMRDRAGWIPVNEHMQTNIPHIYAIGDITGKQMFAHVASHCGIVAAAHCMGENLSVEKTAIPWVIFTSPEIAHVGMHFAQAKERHSRAEKCMVPLQVLGKAHANRDLEGFAQLIFDRESGEIFGAQVVGKGAGHLITEITLAMREELTIDSLMQTIHPHPTLSEVWMEAAFAGRKMALHL